MNYVIYLINMDAHSILEIHSMGKAIDIWSINEEAPVLECLELILQPSFLSVHTP